MRILLSLALLALCDSSNHDELKELKAVEHEVDSLSARYVAMELHRQSEPARAGCDACTWTDLNYCREHHVLADHCCCDRQHQEPFHYISHTCYLDDLPLCRPIAADCEEYLRIDVCCCQSMLREIYASSIPASYKISKLLSIISILLLILTT